MEPLQIKTPDNINWYVERYTPDNGSSTTQNAAPIVLIPSGEGDCGNLGKVARLLADTGYTILTFDNPGFSRTQAPKEAYHALTPQLFARQIVTLLEELHIPRATFFGNSSGANAIIAITALYPERLVKGIIHEAPFGVFPALAEAAATKTDEELSPWCEHFFANYFVEQDENDGRAKWDALGRDYHDRLKRNYVTWMRCVVGDFTTQTRELATPENLRKRPIFWTVGGMSDRDAWAMDWEVAGAAGIEVRTDVLRCLHFPYVSIPERLRDWIVECVEK